MKYRVLSVLLASCMLAVPSLSSAFVPVSAVDSGVAETRTVTVGNLVFELCGSAAMLADVVDKNVTSIKIPAYVEGAEVVYGRMLSFYECPNLERIEVEEGSDFYSVDGVLFLRKRDGDALVAYPPAKEGSYIIPDGTAVIEPSAFRKAEKLTELTIPESVQSIGVAAFHNCTSLEEIHGEIKGIDGNWFLNCSSLKRIVFAEAEDEAHRPLLELNINGCTALEELIIPKSRCLYQVYFVNCPNLKKLVCLGSVFTFGGKIAGCHEDLAVYGYESNGVLRQICSDNEVTFVPIEYQAGDTDGNGTVDIVDVLALNQYLLNLNQLDEAGIKSADVDKNGKVDDADAIKILKSLVDLDTLD